MKISEKIAIIIGAALFVIFVTGLAWSISTGLAGFARSIPFWIIVIFCIFLLFLKLIVEPTDDSGNNTLVGIPQRVGSDDLESFDP